jgi:hypothetical protein
MLKPILAFLKSCKRKWIRPRYQAHLARHGEVILLGCLDLRTRTEHDIMFSEFELPRIADRLRGLACWRSIELRATTDSHMVGVIYIPCRAVPIVLTAIEEFLKAEGEATSPAP